MNKFTAILLSPLVLLAGCAEVQEVATKVITDPNVIAAAQAAGTAAVGVVVMSRPEIAAVATAGVALATAVTALVKRIKK